MRVTLEIPLFWDVTTHCWINGSRDFEGILCLILEGSRSVKMTLTTKWNSVSGFWKGGRGRRICE
jgi:hypothetical protein